MTFHVMQSLLENALARDELVQRGLSEWPRRLRPRARDVARRRLQPLVGDPRKSWDVLESVKLLERDGLKGERVVDLGAFASEILCCLARAGFEDLAGIDLNPAVRRMPHGHVVDWRVGDMLATGLPAGCAGAVTSISAIEHGFDADRLLAEVARLLRPGGLFVGSTDYWPDKIDTRGVLVFGMPWTIFSADEIRRFFDVAARHGLRPVGELALAAAEPCIHFEDRRYTFGWFALRKAAA